MRLARRGEGHGGDVVAVGEHRQKAPQQQLEVEAADSLFVDQSLYVQDVVQALDLSPASVAPLRAARFCVIDCWRHKQQSCRFAVGQGPFRSRSSPPATSSGQMATNDPRAATGARR